MPFGIGLGTTPIPVDTAGALFAAFGADLVDAKGNITVESDAVRQVLEYAQKLVKFLPADAVSYDDASNNRALISGKSALIWNPPSAWAVAKRDAPQVAADCWTFSAPKGPKGRFVPFSQFVLGHLAVRAEQDRGEGADRIPDAARAGGAALRRPSRATTSRRSPSMPDFKVWEDVEPPKGTVFNYPVRPCASREPNIAGFPAPPDIAVQIYQRGIYPAMLARLQSGQSIKQVIAWAKDELEGFVR